MLEKLPFPLHLPRERSSTFFSVGLLTLHHESDVAIVAVMNG